MLPLWPTFSVTLSPTGPLSTYYQTNFKFNINETSEAEGIADHATILFGVVFLVEIGITSASLLGRWMD